jgi:tetratricopeptide (TPR) repeat protein
MRNRNFRRLSLILSVVVATAFSLSAQERADVIKTYNDGVKQIQTNIDSAIISFNNVIQMADKIGESANDLKQNAIQALPGLYLKSATNKYSAKKPASEIARAAKQAVASAEKYNNEQVKESAKNVLVQAYNRMGTEFFGKKDYDNAVAAFDSVLSVNPDYLAAMYNKALIYRTQGNADSLEKTVDEYLSKLPASDDAKKKQASQLALEYFRAAGSQANQEDKLDDALNLLNKAAKYGDDKDLNYFFADVYNKKKEFAKGAEYAQKGLDMETGTADAKAKFYFQLGLAREGEGKTEEACAAFKNAMFGPFAEPSKAKRTNLKCQ